MINRHEHPVGWAQLMSELEDAHEHLGRLIAEMTENTDYGDPNLAVDLGHVFAHLNRAWYCRTKPDNLSDAEWESAREYPSDLRPIA